MTKILKYVILTMVLGFASFGAYVLYLFVEEIRKGDFP